MPASIRVPGYAKPTATSGLFIHQSVNKAKTANARRIIQGMSRPEYPPDQTAPATSRVNTASWSISTSDTATYSMPPCLQERKLNP
jgi:hypothetical protein